MKRCIWQVWFVGLLALGLVIFAESSREQSTQAQESQQAQKAKKKDRSAKKADKKKADDEPQWVWRNPQTPASTQFKTFKSATLKGQEVSYLFWAPPGYDSQDQTKRYPVAYFLHGGGGNYSHIPEAFLPQAATAIQAGTLPPFIGIV